MENRVRLFLLMDLCNTVMLKQRWYAVFNIRIGWNALTANIASWILAVAFAYVTNRTWVFESSTDRGSNLIKEITVFVGGRIATLVIEELILFIFITEFEMNSILIKIVAQVVVIALNYVISKMIVFKPEGGNL